MPRVHDDLKPSAADQIGISPAVCRGHYSVAGAPQHQCRHRNTVQPVLELRVVHMRPPGVEAERIPVAGEEDHFVIAHRVVYSRLPAETPAAGRPARRIMPAASVQLLWRGVEEMHDVALFAAADLDAYRVDQHEAVDFWRAGGGDLRGDPAAEREADQCRFTGQRVEHLAVEMDEIVHRVEIGRPRRVPETRSRRCYDLAMLGQTVEKRGVRRDRVDAVDQQDWPSPAAPQHLDLAKAN